MSDITFNVMENDKIALVGINGSGKTTLFKIITGLESYDSGELTTSKITKIGYVQQHLLSDSSRTPYEEVLTAYNRLFELEKELENIRLQLEGSDVNNTEELIAEQARKQEEFIDNDGLVFKNKAKSALLGLGLDEETIGRPIDTLSGGQKAKVQLAKMLLSDSNLLLLDEPTNHLDIQATEWLEAFLMSYNRALIVISHDRYFLDRIASKTLEIENSKLKIYNCSYSKHIDMKSTNAEIQRRHYNNALKEIKRIEGIIEQQRRWNREKNIRTAESKMKQLEKLKKNIDKPEREPDELSFQFETKRECGIEAISAENLSLKYGDNLIFSEVNLLIQNRERVFLIGPNGCGKTSLFKVLAGKIPPSSGYRKLGASADLGYFDQSQADLNPDLNAVEEIRYRYPRLSDTEIRNALAAFLFKQDEVFKKIADLSGGEKARVALLKLMLSRNNVLLLDEPTNHLDISSREALESALMNYDGALFIISHDRYFINKLADKIYIMENGKITEHIGDYDEYIENKKMAEAAIDNGKPSPKKTNEYKMRKERESNERKRISAIKRLEETIAESEEDISNLQNALNSPEIQDDYEALIDLANKLEEKHLNLDLLYSRWEELHESEAVLNK